MVIPSGDKPTFLTALVFSKADLGVAAAKGAKSAGLPSSPGSNNRGTPEPNWESSVWWRTLAFTPAMSPHMPPKERIGSRNKPIYYYSVYSVRSVRLPKGPIK